MDRNCYLKEIYKFQDGDNYFGLDVHNALFFKMNKVTWDVLDTFPHYEKLNSRYDDLQLKDAIDSLAKNRFLGLAPQNVEINKEQLSSISLPLTAVGLCLQETGPGSLMPLQIIRRSVDLLMQESGENEECYLVFIIDEFEKSAAVIEEAITYGRAQGEKYNKKINVSLKTRQFPISSGCVKFAMAHQLPLEIEITTGQCRQDVYKELSDNAARDLRQRLAPLFKNIIITLSIDSEIISSPGSILTNLEKIGFLMIFFDFLCPRCPGNGKVLGNNCQPGTLSDNAPVFKQYMYDHSAYNGRNSFSVINIIPLIHTVMTSGKIRSGCRAGLNYIAVSSEGDIYPCHKTIANGSFKLGSIFAGLNRDRWEQIALHSVENKAACCKCGVRYLCGGGSPLNAIGIPPSGCQLSKEMAENAMARYQRLDLKQKAQVIGITNRMKNIMPYRWAAPGKTIPDGIIRLLTVKGSSMSPFLKENDRVVVRPLERKKIKNGDIVCFGKPATCHRVIWKYRKKGRCYVLEKGDHQLKGTFIPLEEVSGKVASVQKEVHSYNLDTKRWVFLNMIIALFSLLVHVSGVIFKPSGRRKKTKWRKY